MDDDWGFGPIFGDLHMVRGGDDGELSDVTYPHPILDAVDVDLTYQFVHGYEIFWNRSLGHLFGCSLEPLVRSRQEFSESIGVELLGGAGCPTWLGWASMRSPRCWASPQLKKIINVS